MKKVGILGGTFNPIHNAHIHIAKCAQEQFGLEEIWFMPAGNPPHKDVSMDTSSEARAEMVKLAIRDYDSFLFCDVEIHEKKPCYSWKTLEKLHEKYHNTISFYFIIGEDSFFQFEHWMKPEKICRYANILVAKRLTDCRESDVSFENKKKQLEDRFGNVFFEIKVAETDISSSEIREQLLRGEKIMPAIPKEVYAYIISNHLYEAGYHMEEVKELQKQIKKILKKERYEHTLGVMYTAGNLAFRYQYPYEKAMIAGLLHDCAKCMSDEERLSICKKNHIPVSAVEKKNPQLLHGKVGAYLAETLYDISDKEICHAIAYHTTGCPKMSLLDKIIYIADYIEPNRTKAPRLQEIRQKAYEDIDMCVYMILEDTMQYLNRHPENLDDTTAETYAYFKNLLK